MTRAIMSALTQTDFLIGERVQDKAE
jgi:hypothetical protein